MVIVRFAFVTPRYGADLTSGAEHVCRLLAQQVSERHDVEVLTTCAANPRTWKNEYTEGSDRIRRVLVRRFAVSQPHDRESFAHLSQRLFSEPHTRGDEIEWTRRLGPWAPGLVEHLTRQHRSYDVLVFFSLWHPTTVQGLQIAPDRSVLFPYIQLRPALRFGLWSELLNMARGVGYVSVSERRLARGYLQARPHAEELVGIGIDPPPQQTYPRHQQDPADTIVADEDLGADTAPIEDSYLHARGVPFRRRHRLHGSFALYGGRIGTDNGCEEMLEYFDGYAQQQPDAALVLMGVKMMKLAEEPYLRLAGVLPERERMVAFEAADVTIAPASDDLLAQPLLESLAVGTPVLASAANRAAVEHCRRANGGLYYANRDEFSEALRLVMGNAKLREALGSSGRRYVQQHYGWDNVLSRFDRLVARVRPRTS
jgi:glycosyltransferase involved in cell wall biosynthesis